MTTLRTTNLGRGLCLGGAGLGAIGLIRWFTGANPLATIVPGQPPMMPNAALALLLLGLAGALLYATGRATRWLSALAAVITLGIGLVTIAEYAFNLPFSIDQLLIRTEAGPYPGRPSPPTALDLALLAAAILIIDSFPATRIRPSEWLCLCAGLIAFTALLAQAFGAGDVYEIINQPVVGVAIPTALSLLMISLGVLLERPERGVMGLATSSGPGGMLLRRLAAVAILVPVLFGLAATWILTLPGVNEVSVLLALIVMSSLVSLSYLTTTAEYLNRAHDAQEQTRAQTRDVIELASDGIFIANLEGRYVDVNAAGLRMLGYSREEILGKTIIDLIPPEDEARLWDDRERFLQGGTNVGEWRVRTKGGTYIPLEISAKILPDGRWLAFVRDISERKRADEVLRQAQERFDLALKGANLATWDWNIKTGEVIFNPRWAEMRGFRPEEVSPSADSWSSGIHPDDRATVQSMLKDCFDGARSEFECEYRVATKSGEWIWILDCGKVFARDAEGRPARMVGTELDITARRQAEEQIREAQERLDLALKGADLATWDWNVKTGKVIFNPRWAEMRGFRLEEIEPHVDSAFADIHPDDLPAVHKALDDCFEGLLPEYEATFRISTRSGDWIWLLSRGKLFGRDERGRPTRMVGTAFDITARKRAEEALRLSEAEAKRATQARDDILGIVAHDLRNPLAAIASLAHVLREKGPEHEVGDEIAVAANRMNRLIGDLLDVTRMEAGHLSLKQQRLPAAEIITDALEGQTPLASAASLELRLETAPELPDISADRDRLLQVFENLIGNAIKFTKPGGRITLGATTRPGEVMFSVSDTGRGIASTHLPHVFDRFWQAPGTERRGMGFGLAIVKGIVEAHGGRVWVRSTPGEGSTFFFTIPTAAAQTAASHAAQ